MNRGWPVRTFKNILALWNQMPEGMEVVKRAVDLSRKGKGCVTVLQVIPRFSTGAIGQMDPSELSVRLHVLQKARAQLERRTALFFQGGLNIRVKVVMGDPVTSVVSQVLRYEHDAVIISSETTSAWSGKVFENNLARQLMRACPGPLWVLKPGSYKRRLKRILVPLDLGPYNPQQADLNKQILRIALTTASLEKSELHITHAINDYGSAGDLPAGRIKAVMRHANMRQRLQLDAMLRMLERKLPTRVHIREGNPYHVISTLSRQFDIDLIIMGVSPRPGAPGLVTCHTAENLLRDVSSSVLAVKPDLQLVSIARTETAKVPAEAAAA